LHLFPTIIKTDQKSVSFLFSPNKSRIKNDKILRWRLELSNYKYDICYRKGSENVLADTLSRVAAITSSKHHLIDLHNALAHPGVTRFWEYIQRHHLPFSLEEVRETSKNCRTCLECKPIFFKPPKTTKLIKAMQPFERLGIDIIGPKQLSASKNRFILTVVDEYSRFPFAFPLKTITSEAVIGCLRQLFSIFGIPGFIHTDRGSQFLSNEFEEFCHSSNISHSRTTPYHPNGNEQTERYNGTIWKAVTCLLHARNLSQCQWDVVLPESLAAVRSLLCTATGETPHSRFLKYERRGSIGQAVPTWLKRGRQVYLKNFVRNKDDPLVTPVIVENVINDHFAKIQYPNGREDTVSTTSLAPGSPSMQESTAPLPSVCNQPQDKPSPENSTVVNSQNQTALSEDSDEDVEPVKQNKDFYGGGFNYIRPVRDRKPPVRYTP